MAQFGAEKRWHQLLFSTAEIRYKSLRLWHKNKQGPRMLVFVSDGPLVGGRHVFFLGFSILAVISLGLLDACCCFGPYNTVASSGTLLLCQILPFQISPVPNPPPPPFRYNKCDFWYTHCLRGRGSDEGCRVGRHFLHTSPIFAELADARMPLPRMSRTVGYPARQPSERR